ncbi:MAG TPA: hypothetical protein VF063_10145 [Gaiellaceae bacterium]
MTRKPATWIRGDLAATRRAVAAADEAHIRNALLSVTWERQGLFQRLTSRPC